MILRAGEMQTPECCHEHLVPVKHRKQSRTLRQILQDAGVSGIKHPSHPNNSVWPSQVSARCCSHHLYFTKKIFLYYPNTQSQTFEHFANTLCSNLGLVVSLPCLSLNSLAAIQDLRGLGVFSVWL